MKAAAAAALKGRNALAAAEAEDFEAGPSDEEPESGSEDGSSGASSSEGEEEEAAGSDQGADDEEDFGSDDGVEDGLEEGPSGSEGELDDADSGSEGEGGSGQQQQAGFLEGGKAASFAKAFAKIIDTSGKKAAEVPATAAAPILAASKSIAKRKAEEAEEQRQDREAKKLRQEMKQRGHVVPKRRGQDPAKDVEEKGLQRLATKGVVRLFNAIAKAQKQLREAEEATGSRTKAVKLGKASFLAQLKGSGAAAAGGQRGEVLVPSAPAQQGLAAAAAGPAGGRKQQQRLQAAAAEDSSDEDASGWDVLQQGFVGLQGGSKMKDWDKQDSEEEGGGGGGDTLEGLSSDDD